MIARILGLLSRFQSHERGNVLMLFAFALIPILGVVGVAIDYGRASQLRTELNAAADAAALSATSNTAILKPVAEAKAAAEKLFDDNAAALGATGASRTVTVTENGLMRTTVVSYKTTYQTSLLPLLGFSAIDLANSVTATGSRAPYIDFYLLLDNTPSMGVAATQAEITRMEEATKNTRRCAFACHDLNNPNNFYNLAKKIGIQMRIDVVRKASQELMDTASKSAKVPGQYRMASYTMGASCQGAKLTEVGSLTENMATAKQKAEAIDLMTIPYDQYNSDMCTNFNAALDALNAVIPGAGAGADKDRPQKVVYFVSDGVTDYANAKGCAKPVAGSVRCQEPINTKYCEALKQRGIKVAVLYTTYLPLPSDGWYNSWIKPFASQIPTNMQSCASPGLYFEVGMNGGISDAMTALFQKIVLTSYLSQ